MLSVSSGIVLLVILVCVCGILKSKDADVKMGFTIVLFIFGVISIFLFCSIVKSVNGIAYEAQIDRKIEMYQAENAQIEAKIDAIVDAYLLHESETLGSFKTEGDAMTLVTVLPGLNSDTVIQEQMEIYLENNEEIKELKEDKIDIGQIRWKLYFGH